MEAKLQYTTNIIEPTAIYRRWNHAQRDYVDTKNRVIVNTAPAPPLPTTWSRRISLDPSIPPADGSTPFLRLPTELRLQIYSYLTASREEITKEMNLQFAHHLPVPSYFYFPPPAPKPAPSTTYAYLYRSPGRVTRPHPIMPAVIRLFHINHRIREELLDSCFADRTFVLEASLYRRDVGGLEVLPPRLGMTAWIKKLLLVTVLERQYWQSVGVADLTPLQEMVNLRELRVIFRAKEGVDPTQAVNNPIRAVLSCVPRRTKVSFGADDALQRELLAELGCGIEYLFSGNANAEVAYQRLVENLEDVSVDQGKFSGSHVNHGTCRFPVCQERTRGKRCMNSQTPALLRLPEDEGSPPGSPPIDEPLRYHCGCVMLKQDGSYYAHKCLAEEREKPPVTVNLEAAAPGNEVELRSLGSQSSRSTLLRRKRRSWSSWASNKA